MRERLRSLIGGDAYAVTVNTIHGFCDGIICRNAGVFSEWESKKSLSDLEKYKAMESLIDAIADSSALINPKNPYDRVSAILGRISDCKREGKNLIDLQKVADEYDTLMEGKSKKTTKQYQKNLLQAQKFRDFVGLFRRYQDFLQEHDVYDYDDMILTVLAALREEEWLLASLQERYQYILVDEAQDLNGAQWKVIERLTTYETVPHEPNFFLVGDDDQSIYRFQGANLEHMLQFRERFPKAPIIVLTVNYRSTQTILDAAGRLIAHNDERLIGRIPGLKKELIASTKEKGSEPMLLRPPSDTAEPWLVADLAEERIRSGIPPEEIAVLVQTNSELFPLYDTLRARGTPVILQGKSDLLGHSIVSQAVTILKSVQSGAEYPFLHALACECLGCHPADIARVIASARAEKRSAIDVLLEIEKTELVLTNPKTLLAARDVLLGLHQKKDSRTVLETLEHVLRESGLAAETGDPLDLAAIEAFFRYVKDHCLERPALGLKEFLQDLGFYGDDTYSQLRLTYQLPHLVTSGVQLLTAHQSKGLEFSTVIMTSFREGHWDERKNPSRLAVPEDLLFGWETEQRRYEKHQDERRVAYVAMTRAKRELLMLCPREFSVGERARPVSPSAFFAEAGPLPEADATLKDPERSSLLLLKPQRVPDAELRAYLLERIKNFALSPSALSTFLESPLAFMRRHLLGQPEELTPDSLLALGYGSAVHWALKEWAVSLRKNEECDEAKFLEAFRWHLAEKNVLTDAQRRNLLSLAKDALPSYFRALLAGTHPVIYAAEREYRAMLGDPSQPDFAGTSIPLKGKIDRIDLASPISADAIVIDYKTGAPKTPAAIRGGIEAGTVSRTRDGDNFRQLVFYALLLEQAEPLLVPKAFSLEFIGERGEDPVARRFDVLESEKDDLRALIRQVWAKILALDFTPL